MLTFLIDRAPVPDMKGGFGVGTLSHNLHYKLCVNWRARHRHSDST